MNRMTTLIVIVVFVIGYAFAALHEVDLIHGCEINGYYEGLVQRIDCKEMMK